MNSGIERISLYLHIRRELSPEEKQQICFLQEEGISIIETDDTFSYSELSNTDCDSCNNYHNPSGKDAGTVKQIKICVSNDYDILRQAYNAGWAVIVYLDELSKSQEEKLDCSFVCYATDSLSAIDRTYLQTVYCRCKGIPRVITETDRLLIKEISMSDLNDLTEIFDSNEKSDYFEPFYGSREEAEQYLSAYIKDVYRFYDYGIWGVYLKESGRMIGIAGFTPRPGTGELPVLELGYAIAKGYQRQGYAKEACKAVVRYAQENLEFEKIMINTKNRVFKI